MATKPATPASAKGEADPRLHPSLAIVAAVPESEGKVDALAMHTQQDGDVCKIRAPGQPSDTRTFLFAQAAVRAAQRGGRHLFLTANECFFTSPSGSVRAVAGPRPDDVDEDPRNDGKYFTHVKGLGTPDDVVRWHFVTRARTNLPARLDIEFHETIAPAPSDRITVNLVSSDGRSATCTLTPKVHSGRVCGSLTLTALTAGQYTLELRPSKKCTQFAVRHACLRQRAPLFVVREFWRPRALQVQFKCSHLGPAGAKALVFSVHKTAGESAYVAFMAPFGYVGIRIDAHGAPSVDGDLNFSLWGSKRNARAPPLHQLPHILAIDDGAAAFGTFSHEGHGVKVRNSTGAWATNTSRTYTFSLTMQEELDHAFADGRTYGYTVSTWDERAKQFKRFAYARDFTPRKLRKGLMTRGFVEVTGPPHKNRSGDVRRVVSCSVVAQDAATEQWHVMEQLRARSDRSPAALLCPTFNRHCSVSTSRSAFVLEMGGVLQHADSGADEWITLHNVATDVTVSTKIPVDAHLVSETDSESDDDDGDDGASVAAPGLPFASQLGSVWAPVDFPYIKSHHIETDSKGLQIPIFDVHIPASTESSSNAITIFTGPDDGLSRPDLWTHSFLHTGACRSGATHQIKGSARLLEVGQSDIVARVLVTNQARQVWSEEGYDFQVSKAGQ